MEKNNSDDIDLFVNMFDSKDPYHTKQKADDNIDLFVNMFDSKNAHPIKQKAEKRQKGLEEALKYYENVSSNNHSHSSSKKSNNRLKRFIAIISAGALLAGAGYSAKKANDKSKVNKATATMVYMAEDVLEEHNLGTRENGAFEIGDNTIEDYRVLDVDTLMEVFIYNLAINDSKEFAKFIQSVTYNNGLYAYTDITQFLNINGYYDENKTPSYAVFTNYMEAAIENAINNSTLSQYQDEYEISYDTSEEAHRNR